ncbi:MAG: hypothetical protein ACFCBU_05755 [Cyanophyceae cyanobacterium]
MKKDLSWVYRSLLGIALGIFIVAVPYGIVRPEVGVINGAIAALIITACAVGLGRWGTAFFDAISNALNQSGLY